MAKQLSPIVKLKGTIDDLSFYKTADGFLAREKGGISAERIRTDPKFNLTRLNGLEFAIGGKAGKVFRDAFSTEIAKAADFRVTSRVTKLMVAILQTDPTSDFGYRKVENGQVSLLDKFSFNNQVLIGQVLEPQLAAAFNRTTGAGSVAIPALIPTDHIVIPDGLTHYNIFAAAAAIDFATGNFTLSRAETGILPWNATEVPATDLELTLPADTPLPVFIVVGMEFVKMVNGKPYAASKGQSPLMVMEAFPGVSGGI